MVIYILSVIYIEDFSAQISQSLGLQWPLCHLVEQVVDSILQVKKPDCYRYDSLSSTRIMERKHKLLRTFSWPQGWAPG